MPEPHRPPWGEGPPPWAGRGGFGPSGGRRFRRVGLVALVLLVLLVSLLATVVTRIANGQPPHRGVTVVITIVVLLGIGSIARWFWRSTRSVGALMDAADRVAGGEYSTRVGEVPSPQLRRLAASFDQMTQRLATNEQRRRELLADVAHELRTPLQAIRGSVEGMLDGLYPADPEHLRPVLERTELMARLLDDLRTLSMADAGVLELHRETVDPRAIAWDGATASRGAAARRGVELEVVAAPGTPQTIEADPVRLTEVVGNLLTNAVRHANHQVVVRLEPNGSRGVGIQVEDDGSGIAADQLPHVFDRFVTSADAGGTGLGLAIAKRLVEAHGGTITATSPPSGGTVVRFDIPG
jgi:two-component system, OmpR family, sensor histidine kinase BaeS